MRFKPIKVAERRDAARYVVVVMVSDEHGCERSEIGANNARHLLADLNNISVDEAQLLLDQANVEFG